MKTQLCFHIFFIPFYQIFLLSVVSGQCQNDQQSILIQLKNDLQHNSSLSTKLVYWNASVVADCCKWVGVSCSKTGQVIGLDLSNKTISAGINDSSVLFKMKNLESLNLAENSFNNIQIPSRFGSFASLKYLNLSESGFSGQIPGELSQLERLETLDLSSYYTLVKLENPNLATLVKNFTKLMGLYLDNVDISSQSSDWGQSLSSSLPNLEVLSLSNCGLSGPFDESLQKLQSLSVIRLALNDLSAPVPDFFANFKSLTVMNLAFCNLTGTFPNKVLRLQNLQILDLAVNENLYGSLPDDFPVDGSFRSLVLTFTNFSGGIPESIGNLKNLSTINLSYSNFSGEIPISIQNLAKLEYIDLSSNNFIGQISSFQMCKNLTYVDLSHNSLSGTIPPPHFQDLENLVSVDLRFNGLHGGIPSSLFTLQKLQHIQLSNNNFGGLLANISNPSLEILDLSSNKLIGEIPRSIFQLPNLSSLSLSSNSLSGNIRISDFQDLLSDLDLSYNNLSIITSNNITLRNHVPNLSYLNLASCNLSKFPNLRNQTRLTYLDLSNNKIEGKIPSWIWEVGSGHLNFSHNLLTSFEEPYSFTPLYVLDLSSNHLSGVIPIPPTNAKFVDYSNNLFNSSLPETIGTNLTFAIFFSVSNNTLTGVIPQTICNASYIGVLDMSNNQLSGRIPKCLIESIYLGVLNLGNNGLTGRIKGRFPNKGRLNTLDLHGNHLQGKIPESLVNCEMLEVLNLGKNNISDMFPCFLSKNTNLHVLVLRSNQFHGSMSCGHNKWPMLQILDIAHNNFSGSVSSEFFGQWGAMMANDNRQGSNQHLNFNEKQPKEYQVSVTLTIKGHELELVKILTIFTSIDILSNRFSGEIPDTVSQLKALYLLNISHNEFTGSIPPSITNLSQLESLDMSSNKLTGNIPSVLANLRFIGFLNLSYNQLEGKIPTGKQFNTFDNNSYIGNNRLCGFPLNRSCTNTITHPPDLKDLKESDDDDEKDWRSVFYGLGFGLVISVMFSLWKGYSSGTSRSRNLSR